MWCTPMYADVQLEDRPRIYRPNYHQPYAYPAAGYAPARGVYYAPPKIRVKGPKYATQVRNKHSLLSHHRLHRLRLLFLFQFG